ncbi:MAG: hypothetical protein OEV85_13545 [Candidatus Thorarchaeota archaeon]|nr:hypothetical protein [Candidatus Thorarchaeota archaeon]
MGRLIKHLCRKKLMVDVAAQDDPLMANHSFTDDDVELNLIPSSDSSERVKQIVIASVLASLSIAIAPTASMIARVAGWGIALFDPVSLFWIAAFLVGGRRVGVISMCAGTLGLFLYDPTAIGPIFKFLATAPMILIPWIGVQKLKVKAGGKALSSPKFYFSLMLLAFVVRLAIMIPMNFLYWGLILPVLDTETILYILTVVLSINSVQSIGDALVPFLVVHPTGIYKYFGIW